MYRIYGLQVKPVSDGYYMNQYSNCREWQRLTSENIPYDDIYKAVYEMTLNEIEAVYDNREVAYENRFIENFC